jgi:hypothetical protein
MKKVIFSLALLLTCSLLGYAQKGISYQAIILDPNPIEIPGQDITGQPFVNGAVSLKFRIYSANLIQEFEEVHTTQTDAFGTINVLIGSQNTGAFSSLVWDSKQKSLHVLVSFDQGGTYTKVSEQQLTYNPMALFAETAGKLSETLSIAGGGTGATTAAAARTNLGLGNVDNTSDAAKPISTATQGALATKANANEVTTALATKANAAEVTSALATKANAAEVNTALATKANASEVTISLGLKEDVSNKANTPLGTSTSLYPTQNAVKTYVDAQVAGATIADANGSTKGKIQLAGDLAGTASLPTVPGLAAKADAAAVNTALNLKANAADVTTALATKANAADVTTALSIKETTDNKSISVLTDGGSDNKYPTVKSVKTYVDSQVAGATIADADGSTKGKIQLAGDLAGTAASPTVPGLALKENSANKSTNVSTDGASDSKYPSVKAVKSYVDAQLAAGVASATIADADASTKGKIQLTGDLGGTAAAPTVPGLALKANATDLLSLTSDVNSNTASITANTSSIAGETTRATTAELILTNSVAANTASITANASSIAGETTRATAAELALTNSVAANTASITANTSSIAGETTRATAAELVLTNSVAANAASITANIAAIDLKAPIASPTFTGTLTAPIYATTPQLLTSGSTITWNPTQGLNASVKLDQNSTLSFSATPPSGSYGTLVVTQDGTGGRTLTLPSIANKVLGSTSNTSIALSTTAGAKDIINFYYDGTNCYWNVGQGYGVSPIPVPVSAATLNTARTIHGGSFDGTANVTNIIASTFGGTGNAYTKFLGPSTTEKTFTLPDANATILTNNAVVTVAQGGTGATTLTGLVKGNGTSALTAAVSGTDYQAPLNLTTTGTGAATLSGTTINIPTPASSGSITYSIGLNNDLGGYIIYVTPNGKHGLVAATQNQVTGGSIEIIYNRVNQPSYHNTAGKEFTDWRIPTLWEMQQVLGYKSQIGGFDISYYYFIISNYTTTSSGFVIDADNGQSGSGFLQPLSLRAVRSF